MTPEITLSAPPSSSSRPLGSLRVVISESGLVLVRIRMFLKFPYCAYNNENGAGRSPMAEYQSWERVWIFWIDCNFISWAFISLPVKQDHWSEMVSRAPSEWATVHSQITEGLAFPLHELFGLFFLLGNHDSVTIRSSWVMWLENLHWFLCEFSAA